MTDFIEIDGSYLEGGGQILRIALGLSCILKKPVRITKIRANRVNGGLRNQQLGVINLLSKICNARVRGAELNSTTVEFEPNKIKLGTYMEDTGTAASVTLVIQAVLPVLLFADGPSEVSIKGGTNVLMAPQVECFTKVISPILQKFGATSDFELLKRGYYPTGGGHIKLKVHPVAQFLTGADIANFGRLLKIEGSVFAAGRIEKEAAVKIKNEVEKYFSVLFGSERVEIMAYKETADMADKDALGFVFASVTDTGCRLGSSALIQKGIFASDADKAANLELADHIRNEICVDRYTQDQLIIYMALASGETKMKTCKLTTHTLTAIHIVTKMTGVVFNFERTKNHSIVSCNGSGHVNAYYKKK